MVNAGNGMGNGASARAKLIASLGALLVAGAFWVAGILPPAQTPETDAVATQQVQSTSSASGSASSAGSVAGLSDAPSSQVEAARSDQLRFRSNDRLASHFTKHGDEVGCSSEDDYLAAANAVVANTSALHRVTTDGDDAYFVERTGEFVVISNKGYLRTYFVTDLDYFERQ